jgi:hypothetical protein
MHQVPEDSYKIPAREGSAQVLSLASGARRYVFGKDATVSVHRIAPTANEPKVGVNLVTTVVDDLKKGYSGLVLDRDAGIRVIKEMMDALSIGVLELTD